MSIRDVYFAHTPSEGARGRILKANPGQYTEFSISYILLVVTNSYVSLGSQLSRNLIRP